jgi:2-polyprenyl-6-methoxyphenol hydroxylase-like FAD-dependent oxidoreductase
MKIAIVGGGPAGLYFADLMKRDDPSHDIHVYERNPEGATWGFGVVFSDRALEFLRTDDEDLYRVLRPNMETWPDLTLVHREQRIAIDGNGFSAIGRLRLLTLLQARARARGVELHFESEIAALDAAPEISDADLIVAADGANSLLRNGARDQFGTAIQFRSNRFIWYGTTKPFDSLTLTFRTNPDGVFCAHHYRYEARMSTFLIEVDAATFERAGFGLMCAEETRRYCEDVFAADLDGHALVSNKSNWRNFPAIWNENWSAGKVVLLGDALRTAHFSIGSGTRLALEDAVALNKAFAETGGGAGGDIAAAFARFEALRRPPSGAIRAAAEVSAGWYEGMAELMDLAPYDFAHSYMTRTGRVSDTDLEKIAPRFMADYRRAAS